MNSEDAVQQLSLELEKVSSQDERTIKNIQNLINDLLVNDFNQLVNILYRMDVNENKLKKLLHANPGTDASVLIADLLIERQLEKIKTKRSFKNNNRIDENEKW
jgi:hypothetical protein